MKSIIILLLTLSTVATSLAQTKGELIEKLFIVSNGKARFEEAFQTITALKKDDLSEDFIEILKTHCTWENWKKIQIKIINDFYTKEELEIIIMFYADPNFQKIYQKSLSYALQTKKAETQWVNELLPEISAELDNQPRKPSRHSLSNAQIWNKLKDRQRWYYIDGYKDGTKEAYHFFLDELESHTNTAPELVEVLEAAIEKLKLFSDTQKLTYAVTDFYLNPENKEIGHISALHLADTQLRGQDISEKLQKARKKFEPRSEPCR